MAVIMYQNRILELAQKWRTEAINSSEFKELNCWFSVLEGRELGAPIEINVDALEKLLHKQFSSNKKIEDNQVSPPHPWHKLDFRI